MVAVKIKDVDGKSAKFPRNGLAVRYSDETSFSDLLPYGSCYGDPADGVLFLQEPQALHVAALGVAWNIDPVNVGVMAQPAVQQVAQAFDILFRSVTPGVTVQAIQHSAPIDWVEEWSNYRGEVEDLYALNEFQEASIREGLVHSDGARTWRLRRYTTTFTLRVGVTLSENAQVNRLMSLFRSEGRVIRQLDDEILAQLSEPAEVLGNLRNLCETVFSLAGIEFQRLAAHEMHREILRCLQPWVTDGHFRTYTPDLPMRDQLLSVPAAATPESAWQFGPDPVMAEAEGFQVGKKEGEDPFWEARVMSLQQAPARTFPGIMSSLHAPEDAEPLALWEVVPDYPLTVCTQVGVPDQQEERQRLRQKRTFANLQAKTALGEVDVEKLQLREDLDRMMRDATSYILHTRVHLVLWHPVSRRRRFNSVFANITQTGRRIGLEFLPETVLGTRLFLQTLPLGFNLQYPSDKFLRRSRRMPSVSSSHLLPVYGDFRGTRTPAQLYTSRRGEPVTFDFFDSDAAPHTVVAGKSRSGKSFFVNHMLQQVLPIGASVVILDRWASYDTLCEVYKGEYVEVDLDKPLCFNPFDGPLDAGHRTFLLALIDQMASGVSGSDAVGLGQVEKAVCSRLLSLFGEWHEKEKGKGVEARFADFHHFLDNPLELDPEFVEVERARQIALRVSQFVGRGEYAGFIDGVNELNLRNSLTIFELAKLGDAPDLQSVLLLTLMYRLMQFVTDPEARTRRKYLILDEVWALLKHATAAAFLEEAARALARFRCCAIFMSQQLSDFHSDAAKAIKGNSSNYVFLQQNAEEVQIIGELFELGTQEIRILKEVRKRPTFGEAYLWQPEGRGGVIRVVADPFLRWLASQKPHEKAAREHLNKELDGDLSAAVRFLARQYPLGFQHEVSQSDYMPLFESFREDLREESWRAAAMAAISGVETTTSSDAPGSEEAGVS